MELQIDQDCRNVHQEQSEYPGVSLKGMNGAYVFDLEEQCPVCEDKVSGYHYGLLTCESCKGFFKRTVQNDKRYNCTENQDCKIDKMQRKRCPFCRFQKCITVGMRLEAVRKDRIRGGRNKFGPMYKRDRALKQQRKALIQASSPKPKSRDLLLTPPEIQTSCGSLCPSPMYKAPPLAHPNPPGSSPYPVSIPGFLSGLYQYRPSAFSNRSMKSETSTSCSSTDSLPGSGLQDGRCPSTSPQRHSVVAMAAPLVQELLRCELDEAHVRARVLQHLQGGEPGPGHQRWGGTFGLVCRVADQTLVSMVDWARGCVFFKELAVGDQMKLLHQCWSELLLLDHMYRQIQHNNQDSVLLVTGQEIEISSVTGQAGAALRTLVQRCRELEVKLQALQVDRGEIACLKFLILLNPLVKFLEGQQFVASVHKQMGRALLEHTVSSYPQSPERFSRLMCVLQELCGLSRQVELYLNCRHRDGDLPGNSLLIEMLHAKVASS